MKPLRKCPYCNRLTRDVGGNEWCSGCGDYVVDRTIVVDVGRWWSRILLALVVALAFGISVGWFMQVVQRFV